jgi:REP element-mobilizing transposase RayT
LELRWRHGILNARCSWLHGDERGFRSRNHRIHSSGDYRHRPPAEEHAGLRRFHGSRSGEPVKFEFAIRAVILMHFVEKMRKLGYRIIAASLGEQHLHFLAELPFDLDEVDRIAGKCKQRASHAVRKELPGSVWSEGGEFKWINGSDHLQNAYSYIRTRQEPGTVVWSHRPEENWIDFDVPVKVMQPRSKRRR